tara:strand:+ start:492 stop:893 length:402 start_codon:yes stop_codon:yes gene_type:complete
MNTPSRKLLDNLTCCICLELYTNPKILACGHLLCEPCTNLININNSLICPICRKPTFDTFLLPSDYSITNIIDDLPNKYKHRKKLKKSKSAPNILTLIENKYTITLESFQQVEDYTISHEPCSRSLPLCCNQQ